MLRRPKPGENEDDLLRMQEEFLKDKNIQPSAQVVNLRKTEHHTTKRANPSTSDLRKPSQYALSKRLNTEKNLRSNIHDEKNTEDRGNKQIDVEEESEIEDDKVYYPKVLPFILGDIVEKNVDEVDNCSKKTSTSCMRVTSILASKSHNEILASKSSPHSKLVTENTNMDIDESLNTLNLPSQSYILTSTDAETIHNENIKMLSKMSEKEILEEKQKLFSTIDSNLVEFIRNKRQKCNANPVVSASNSAQNKTDNGNIQTQSLMHNKSNEQDVGNIQQYSVNNDDTLWENDVLSNPLVTSWLHFNNLEKDKLEWMKGINNSENLKPNGPYEARFDFNGYLLPYTMEYNEHNKSLFHHGEEPHRPGYSITELFELSRSAVIQQRVMALNILAGILEYSSVGTYKDIIDIPLSKIFFVIRIALDENKVIILEPALKAMRNLLFNRIDEACLDALIGFEEGSYQPCLENDKSEIEENEYNQSELKDYHLAEIDIIAAVLRTDILQRLYYIMETIKPSFNCIQYSLQILTRLSRDSVETANKIVQMDYLMETIIKYFIPNAGINFVFDPSIVYKGKPILAALKLMRILTLQTKDIAEILIVKYYLLKPIATYLNSGVDGTYGIRLQTESFCIITNLVSFNINLQEILQLCPIIITTLYKHVQQTNIYTNTSIVSVTHAAVVLQFVNKLLNCKNINLDMYKVQLYPLLKDGVQKWLTQVAYIDNYTCGHLRLVSSVLDCCNTILNIEDISLPFLNDCFKTVLNTSGFNCIIKNLSSSSNLLSGIEEKDLYYTKNLVSLGASVIESTTKILPILHVTSSIPFLMSLFKLLVSINDLDIIKSYLAKVVPYLKNILKKPLSLTNNWFTRMEVDFLYYIVKNSSKCDIEENFKDLIYAVSNKLCYILRSDKHIELQFLFDNIIFNKYWFSAERLINLVSISEVDNFTEALSTVEDIKSCYSNVLNLKSVPLKSNIEFKQWQAPILPRDWIYLPILTLYSKSQELVCNKLSKAPAQNNTGHEAAEKELVINCSLEWIIFNEICFADLLTDIDVTDRFCRIMCVYLCDNSLFLNDKIKKILFKITQILFKHNKQFNFDKQLTGLSNFQDLYTQFLEQFQSVSYGDPTFAACLLVPLAQRHNIKWRKLLWSEYAGCLRAIDCPENYLCYEINEYLYPEETDQSLLKSYFRSLSNNLLRPNTVSYRIARHHVDCFKNRMDNK